MNSTPCGVAPPAPLLPLTIVSTLPAIGAGKAISFVLSFGIMGPSGLAEFSIERTWYSDGSGIAPTGTISQTNNGVTVSIAYDYDVVDGLSIQIDSATEVSDFVNTVAPTAYKPVAGPSELWISMSSADLGLVGYLPTVASGVNVGTAFLVDTYTSSGIFSHGNYKYYLSEFY